jgi:hypothetical protein
MLCVCARARVCLRARVEGSFVVCRLKPRHRPSCLAAMLPWLRTCRPTSRIWQTSRQFIRTIAASVRLGRQPTTTRCTRTRDTAHHRAWSEPSPTLCAHRRARAGTLRVTIALAPTSAQCFSIGHSACPQLEAQRRLTDVQTKQNRVKVPFPSAGFAFCFPARRIIPSY